MAGWGYASFLLTELLIGLKGAAPAAHRWPPIGFKVYSRIWHYTAEIDRVMM